VLEAEFSATGGVAREVGQGFGIFRREDMKGAIILATVIAAVAVGACRKEVPHEPMKLGAEVSKTVQQ
jgi:hypothetical protein